MAFGQLPDRLGGFAQRIHAFSMTGVTSPASMSSLRTSRSFAFSVETSALSFWLTNGESMSAHNARSKPPVHRPPPFPADDYQVPRGARAAP